MRAAILTVSDELLGSLIPPDALLACWTSDDYAALHRALLLPEDAKILSWTTNPRRHGLSLIKVESPDFIDTPAGLPLPEVQGWYCMYHPDYPDCRQPSVPVFQGWDGPAVRAEYRRPTIGEACERDRQRRRASEQAKHERKISFREFL